MKFEKGQSGNPFGRPKKGQGLTDILKLQLDEASDGGISKKEQIARKLIELALDGNLQALIYVFDRLDGKPMQAVKSIDDEGNAIDNRIVIEFVQPDGSISKALPL